MSTRRKPVSTLLSALFWAAWLIGVAPAVYAQAFAYVDAEKIVKLLPEYGEAQQELEQLATQWQSDVEQRQQRVDELWRNYRADEVLLTEKMKADRLAEIEKEERRMRDYQNRLFGYNGLMHLKRQQLMEPLQDIIREAARKVARKRRVDFVLDRSADLVMIYGSERYDLTEEVIEELGLAEGGEK